MNKKWLQPKSIVYTLMKIMIAFLILAIGIFMLQLMVQLFKEILTTGVRDSMLQVMSDVATFFIFIEIELMLVKYLEDIRHVSIKYIIIIAITAIARQILLLSHGSGIEVLLLAASILTLVVVLYLLRKQDQDKRNSNYSKNE